MNEILPHCFCREPGARCCYCGLAHAARYEKPYNPSACGAREQPPGTFNWKPKGEPL